MWYNTKTIKYSYEPTEKELVLKFELAGKTKDNVKVYRKNDALNIKIDNKDTYAVDLVSQFYDVEEYSFENTKACMQHGLLTVRIPKRQDKSHEIEIE